MNDQKKNVLLLTLVHPDFLPPVYAVAQVLRDEGYNINILSFDSYAPAAFDIGSSINIETLGHYDGVSLSERFRLRRAFIKRAKALITYNTAAVIAFCSFSFVVAADIRRNTPFIYIALEVANFTNDLMLASPLTYITNKKAIRNLNKADIVATPSNMRSAWLSGRGNLEYVPLAVYNTAYYTERDNTEESYEMFKQLIPSGLLSHRKIIYTGAVNKAYCIWELVAAFEKVAQDGILIISGIKDNEYCKRIKDQVNTSPKKDKIVLLPVVTRAELVILQRFADIGICLSGLRSGEIKHELIAPNKIGEYIDNGLYLLGNDRRYMSQFEAKGIATIIDEVEVDDIAHGIDNCLHQLKVNPDIKTSIRNYAKNVFCMQVQLKPIVNFINTSKKALF